MDHFIPPSNAAQVGEFPVAGAAPQAHGDRATAASSSDKGRDSCFFIGQRKSSAAIPSVWPAQFAVAQRRRTGLLLKQTPSQILRSEDLLAAFGKVRAVIPEARHAVVSEVARLLIQAALGLLLADRA